MTTTIEHKRNNKLPLIERFGLVGMNRKLWGPSDVSRRKLDRRLVVVSNRLPITLENDETDGLFIRPSSGGLITALAPVLRDTAGVWLGWPGTSKDILLDGHLDRAGSEMGCTFETVSLGQEELDDYYLGFSNRVLWPLFHDFPNICKFDSQQWQAYLRVNRKFARKLVQITDEDDYIWVQDYHLLLVARELAGMGANRRVSFFLHTPFPSLDVFKRLPWRKQIINAMLQYDLIGFQAHRDKQNFLECVKEIANVEGHSDGNGLHHIERRNHTARVGVFPISIDFAEFERLAASSCVARRVEQLHRLCPDCKVLLGVDRLDYSKGIPQRLAAFRSLLERFSELRGKVTMFQVMVPSRDSIPEYRTVREEIEKMVDDINRSFGDDDWLPVHYIYRNLDRAELLAYYRAADVALVTPIKDGMNLVAKEYCVANIENDGVLILSEFAGAAGQMRRSAIMVNPNHTEEVTNAIYRALHMPAEKRRVRMRRLRHSLRRRDIYWWSNLFLRSVKQTAYEEAL